MEIAGFGAFEYQFLVIGQRKGVVAGEVARWFWSDNGDLAAISRLGYLSARRASRIDPMAALRMSRSCKPRIEKLEISIEAGRSDRGAKQGGKN